MTTGRTIELVVLVYGEHCQTARAYLAYLAATGLRPRKILHVIAPGTSPQARQLRPVLGRQLTARLAEWYVMRPFRRPAMRQLCDEAQAGFAVRVNYFGRVNWPALAEDYERLVVDELNSSEVRAALGRQPCRTFLYTAGGRVTAETLAVPGVRVLHIHPGVVPHVRGSDGLLWSLATRGRPGASCFYMSPGIDAGDVIRTREFEPVAITGSLRDAPPEDVAQALVFAYDPHLRAQLLVEVIGDRGPGDDLGSLPTSRQDAATGHDYFGMHPAVVRRLIRSLQAGTAVVKS
jgi:hypothetical protein